MKHLTLIALVLLAGCSGNTSKETGRTIMCGQPDRRAYYVVWYADRSATVIRLVEADVLCTTPAPEIKPESSGAIRQNTTIGRAP